MVFALALVGFVFLVMGARFLVDGAASVARNAGISQIAIGLTIVSIGTSLPEFTVNLTANLNGNAGISLGDAVGSNIANILLILGIAAILRPISARKATFRYEIPISLLAAFVLLVMVNDPLLDGAFSAKLGRAEGLILIGFFLVFCFYIFWTSKSETPVGPQDKIGNPALAFLIALGGAMLLMLGARWFVDGAVALARYLGMPEVTIGLTLVALGTSLPELATTITAAARKMEDIAVGNIVGSNIFNIFWILGFSASLSPMQVPGVLSLVIWWVIGATFLLMLLLLIGKRKWELSAWKGMLLVGGYAGYLGYQVWFGAGHG